MEGNRRLILYQPGPTLEDAEGEEFRAAPLEHTAWARRRDRGGSETLQSDTQVGEWQTSYRIRWLPRLAELSNEWWVFEPLSVSGPDPQVFRADAALTLIVQGGNGSGATVDTFQVNDGAITAITYDGGGADYAAGNVLVFAQGKSQDSAYQTGRYTIAEADVDVVEGVEGVLQDIAGVEIRPDKKGRIFDVEYVNESPEPPRRWLNLYCVAREGITTEGLAIV